MSDGLPRDDADERGLRDLFDQSAQEAGGALLTRLRARASDVPAHVRRRPRFIPRWAWAPAFAGVGVAAITLAAAALSIDWNDSGTPAAPARAADAVIARARAAAMPQDEADDPDVLADEAMAYHPDQDWEDDPRGGPPVLEPLDGLSADENLDAWLFATAELMREGG